MHASMRTVHVGATRKATDIHVRYVMYAPCSADAMRDPINLLCEEKSSKSVTPDVAQENPDIVRDKSMYMYVRTCAHA